MLLKKTNKLDIIKNILIIFIFIFLVYISGFREIGIDKDSQTYSNFIKLVTEKNFKISFRNIEPTFLLITFISHQLFSDVTFGVFLIYSILGVSIKLYSIKKLSLLPFLSIYIYISIYFILHEMTQIRVGVAAGIFLCMIKDIYNKNNFKFFMKFLIAILFHYSSIVLAPLFLITGSKISTYRKKIIYFSLPLIGFISYYFNAIKMDLFSKSIYYFPEFINNKIVIYLNMMEQGFHNNFNLFNPFYLLLISIYYFCLININKFKTEYDNIFIKILGLMLFLFYFFSFIPVISFRISQLLGIILIILIPHIALIFKQKFIGMIFYIVVFLLLLVDRINVLLN